MPNIAPLVLLRLVAVGAVTFAALEGGARLDDRVRYGTPVLARPVGIGDLLVRDSLGVHGRPSAQFRKWRMNALGMRGEDVRLSEAEGTIRVLIAGASETFGFAEAAGREWPAQLQDGLIKRCGPGRHVVLNAAFAGMYLPTVTQDFARRGSGLDPNWFVYYPTPAQYLEPELPVAAPRDTVMRGAHDLPAFRSRFLGRIREQVRDGLPPIVRRWFQDRTVATAREGQSDDWLFRSPPPERLAAFEADLRTLVGTARGAGAKVVLVQHATYVDGPPPAGIRDADFRTVWNRFYPRATIDALIAMEGAAAAIVRRVAADSGALVVDVRSALHGDRDRLFSDQSHLSDAGAGVLAEGVASVLESHGVCHTRDTGSEQLR